MSQHGENLNIDNTQIRSIADSTIVVLFSRIAMLAAVPAMAWMLSSINSMQTDISAMKVEINNGVDDRYRGSEASRDFALRDAEITRNQTDIGKLYSLEALQSQNIAALVIQATDAERRISTLEERRR